MMTRQPVVCPLDPSHLVLSNILEYHLARCHPDIKTEACLFNKTHIFDERFAEEHYFNCIQVPHYRPLVHLLIRLQKGRNDEQAQQVDLHIKRSTPVMEAADTTAPESEDEADEVGSSISRPCDWGPATLAAKIEIPHGEDCLWRLLGFYEAPYYEDCYWEPKRLSLTKAAVDRYYARVTALKAGQPIPTDAILRSMPKPEGTDEIFQQPGPSHVGSRPIYQITSATSDDEEEIAACVKPPTSSRK